MSLSRFRLSEHQPLRLEARSVCSRFLHPQPDLKKPFALSVAGMAEQGFGVDEAAASAAGLAQAAVSLAHLQRFQRIPFQALNMLGRLRICNSAGASVLGSYGNLAYGWAT